MSIAKEGGPRHVRALGNLHSRQRRMASRRRVNRFTGFIPEPWRGFVSQRICRRTRHTTIQKSGGNAGSQGATCHAPASPGDGVATHRLSLRRRNAAILRRLP
ncbi:hypothetical protein DPR02_05855 [Burkholderia cepacia]|uniref:Uncharacterized protein n=1 Tax=Burkholderia cepacia TaxID=292 RepID=A0AAQ0FF08_BURCE|nr:hypothetical protein DPR02_05855 [Burkholderia cepacia]